MQATERFKERQIPGPKPYYATKEWPSLWFEPMEVWEVRALLPALMAGAGPACDLAVSGLRMQIHHYDDGTDAAGLSQGQNCSPCYPLAS